MDPLAKQFDRYRRQGDLLALGEVFDTLAPRLLPVALHLCGNPAGAEDALQQTFVLAIERADSFDATRRLEPWLAGLLSNVARSTRRHEARRWAQELPELAAADAGPVEDAECAELTVLLRTRIDALPPEQRQVLRLQLQHGMTAVEIAEAIEVPPGTVRMRIHRGLVTLRRLLPAGLALWLSAALPTRGLAAVKQAVLQTARARLVASSAAVIGSSAAMVGGVVIMKKLLAGIVVACLLALLWWTRVEPGPSAPLVPDRGGEPATQATAGVVPAGDGRSDDQPAAPRVASDQRAGSLRVEVVAIRPSTDVTAPGLPMAGALLAIWPGESPLVPFEGEVRRVAASDDGVVVLAALAPGPWQVQVLAADDVVVEPVRVEPGREAWLRIERALDRVARGIVVDADGVPVAGAQVWIHRGTAMGKYSMPEPADFTSRCAGRTGVDGRFLVPISPREDRVAACCAGYGESFARRVSTESSELRLVLGRAFATVAGTVRGEAGELVAGALVLLTPVGRDARRTADGVVMGPRVDRMVRTDAEGRFRFEGVAPGRVRVWATASPRLAAWPEVDVAPFANVEIALVMKDGVEVVGTVRNADGTPARVKVFSTSRLPANGHYCHCETREDGSYQLYYQPRQRFFVCVGWHRDVIVHREFVAPEAGVMRCDFVLEGRVTCSGRVLGPDGQPLPAWTVVTNNAAGHRSLRVADGAGRFQVGVPADGAFTLLAYGPDGDEAHPAVVMEVASGTRAVDLCVPAAAIPSGVLVGRLIDEKGAAIGGQRLVLERVDGEGGPRMTTAAADGRFRFEALPDAEVTLSSGSGGGITLAAPVRVGGGRTCDLGDVAVTSPATLLVEIVRSDGAPWQGEVPAIGLFDAAGKRAPSSVEPRPNGTRVLAAAGTYRVAIEGVDLISEPQPIELTTGAEQVLRMRVAIGRSRNLVCNGDGRDKPAGDTALHMTVRAADGAVVVQCDITQLDWSLKGFHFWDLHHVFPFGRYEVEAHTDAGWRYRTTFEVRDNLDDPTRVDVPWVSR